MPLIARFAWLIAVAAMAFPSALALAQADAQSQRVAAAFALGLGRLPTEAELETWTEQGALSIEALSERIASQIARDAAASKAVAEAAFRDVFGRAPSASDLESESASARGYAQRVRQHLKRLESDPREYERAIGRAYRFVIQRDAYPEEVAYWRERGVFSYALLVGCIEDWARRNQPGLMVTAGRPTISINSEYLATARLSPEVAAEARALAGVPPPLSPEQRVVAPAAEPVAASGGMHFVVVGAASRDSE